MFGKKIICLEWQKTKEKKAESTYDFYTLILLSFHNLAYFSSYNFNFCMSSKKQFPTKISTQKRANSHRPPLETQNHLCHFLCLWNGLKNMAFKVFCSIVWLYYILVIILNIYIFPLLWE